SEASGGRIEREAARWRECAGAASRPAEASRTNLVKLRLRAVFALIAVGRPAGAVGLGVAGEIGERAHELAQAVAPVAREIDELDAHARVQVLGVAGAVGVDPDHHALDLEDAEARRAEAQVQPRAGHLGRDGAHEDAHLADVGDVSEQEGVVGAIVHFEVDEHPLPLAPITAGAPFSVEHLWLGVAAAVSLRRHDKAPSCRPHEAVIPCAACGRQAFSREDYSTRIGPRLTRSFASWSPAVT